MVIFQCHVSFRGSMFSNNIKNQKHHDHHLSSFPGPTRFRPRPRCNWPHLRAWLTWSSWSCSTPATTTTTTTTRNTYVFPRFFDSTFRKKYGFQSGFCQMKHPDLWWSSPSQVDISSPKHCRIDLSSCCRHHNIWTLTIHHPPLSRPRGSWNWLQYATNHPCVCQSCRDLWWHLAISSVPIPNHLSWVIKKVPGQVTMV